MELAYVDDFGVIKGNRDFGGLTLLSEESGYFKFTLNEASILAISIHGEEFSPSMTVFDSEGNPLESAEINGIAAEFAAGTYYIRAENTNDDIFAVEFNQFPHVIAGNSSIENGWDLGKVKGTLTVDGLLIPETSSGSEYFKVTLTEESLLSVKAVVLDSMGPVSVSICDSSGQVLSNPSSVGTAALELAPGSYLIRTGSASGTLFSLEIGQQNAGAVLKRGYDLGTITGNQEFENLSTTQMLMAGGFYKFTLTQDSLLRIAGGAEPQISLRVYDSMGNQPGGTSIGDFAGELAAGTYYISVGSVMDSVFNLEFEQCVENMAKHTSFESAFELGTVSESREFGAFYVPDHLANGEYFKFTLESACILKITASSRDSYSASNGIRVYDGSGRELPASGGMNDFTGEFAAGTYYFSVDAMAGGVFSLEIEHCDDEISGYNSLGKAYNIGTVSGKKRVENLYLSDMMSQEYCKFTLTEDSVLRIGKARDDDSVSTIMMEIYNSRGERLDYFNTMNGITGEFAAGSYYISLSGMEELLALEFEQYSNANRNNTSLSTALNLGSISGNKEFNGLYISAMAGSEYYKFSLTEESILKISASGESVYGSSAMMEIYDSRGNRLNLSSTMNGITGEFAAGTYYVSVSGGMNELFSLEFEQYRNGNRNNTSLATALNLGTIQGTQEFEGLYVPSSAMNGEYFKFTLTQDSLLGISTHGEGMMSPQIELYNSSGHCLSGMYMQNSIAELAAGTWYIKISGGTNELFSLQFVQQETCCTGNNSLAAAYNLGTIRGSQEFNDLFISSSAMEQEYYKFTLTQNSLLTVEAARGGVQNVGPSMTFYDSAGQMIEIQPSSATGKVISEFAAGTYYVGISGSASVFSLNFSQQQAVGFDNNSLAKAADLGTIAGEVKIDGLWSSMASEEYFKFTLTEESVLRMESRVQGAEDMGGTPYFCCYDASGEMLHISVDGSGVFAAGTYYISVSGGGMGSYSLEFEQYRNISNNNTSLDDAFDLGAIRGRKKIGGIYFSSDEWDDAKYYKFSVNEDCLLSIITAGSTPWAVNSALRFYDETGNEIHAVAGLDGDLTADFSAGTYYLALESWTEQMVCLQFEQQNVPLSLSASSEEVRWKAVADEEAYIVELSGEMFDTVLSVKSGSNAIDFFNLPSGSFQWQVKTLEGSFYEGENFTSARENSGSEKFVSDSDGDHDLFFAGVSGVWGTNHAAQHSGSADNTLKSQSEYISLAGKNKIADIFEGSEDANILLLTDDANGDALFVEDIFTALPEGVEEQSSRMAQINEIRAGAGDDIIDMTSRRFAYAGDEMKIYGGSGNDTIWANSNNNMLFGDGGNDSLIGGANSDVITGGSGNDAIHGGGGDDIFCFGDNWGTDTVEQSADGKVTLWFAEGNQNCWNTSTLTYSDGRNRVQVTGVSAEDIVLVFGDDRSALYTTLAAAGCFESAASEKIFEERVKGLLA